MRRDGFMKFKLLPILGVMWPIIINMLLFLTLPYFICHGILPLFDCPIWYISFIYRYSYLAVTFTFILVITVGYTVGVFKRLHKQILDDKYLVEKRLQNFNQVGAVVPPTQTVT